MPVILVSMINTGARSATRTAGGLTGGLADGDPRTTRPRRAPDAKAARDADRRRRPPRDTRPSPAPAAPRPVRAVRAARVSAADAAPADHRSLRWDAFGLRGGRGWCRGR